MPRTKTISPVEKVRSFESLLAELRRLEVDLPTHGLERLSVFNTAYLVITQEIADRAEDGYFAHPKFVEQFTVAFAHYYFDALNKMGRNISALPVAWRLTHQAAIDGKAPQAIVLLMGANAHINHDLPLVLAQLISETRAKELFTDVLKVDRILMRSGKAIIPLFSERSRWQNWVKKNLQFLYYRPTMWMVMYWRVRAWKDSRGIMHAAARHNHYAKRSIRNAKLLTWAARLAH